MVMDTAVTTPFERLGGASTVRTIVDAHPQRVWRDPELGPFFHRADRAAQRDRFAAMLSVSLGGPSTYDGMNLREAHAGRGITHRHFSLFAAHLVDALTIDLAVPHDLVDEVLAVIVGARDDVVG